VVHWTLEEREKEWNDRYASRNFKMKNPKSTINSKEQNNITKFPKNSKDVAHRKNQVGRDWRIGGVQSALYDRFEQVGTRKKVQYSKYGVQKSPTGDFRKETIWHGGGYSLYLGT
jgi:hypothetical protein